MIKIFKKLNKTELSMSFIALIFIVSQVWLDLKLPDYMSEITRLTQTPGSEMSAIWNAGGNMLLCALGSFISAIIVGYLASKIAASFSTRLRSMLFSKVDSFSMEEINLFSTSSLITRSTNDVTQIQMIITMGLQLMIKSPIMAIWAITKISGKGFEWTVATGLVLLVMMTVILIVMYFVFPKFKVMQSLIDNINLVMRENLSGLPVVRAYNAEKYQENKFEIANNELTNTQLFTTRSMGVMMPVITTMMSALSLIIYWIGAVLINQAQMMDKLTIFSNMVVFSSYAMQVIVSFMMLVMVFIIAPRASVSANRINEVLESKAGIKSGEVLEGVVGKEGEVVFKDVSFKYPDASDYVLHNISFTVGKGETVAFIGSTGSGKSSLINLIPRFFDATDGEIFINGVEIKEYNLEALRRMIGYVPQKSFMFMGTVESNVNFGDKSIDNTMEDIKDAVRIAQAQDFVENMESGYNSEITQGGTNLSGGQKQRLSIARAIARKPQFYIFDDSFSALDYRTDRVLRKALKKETSGVTTFIVAQRIGTIIDADKILVIDRGEIVGSGKHYELLETCKVYREIALSQLSEEELSA